VVRAATPADAAAAARVKAVGWATTYAAWVPGDILRRYTDVDRQTDETREALRLGHLVLVAEDAPGRIAGVAVAETLNREEPFLDTLHVLPPCRGQGIGERLLRAVAAELVARGHHALTLGVVEQNAGARRFYERLGATATGSASALWAPGDVVEVSYRFAHLTEL
jgi:ribosomal protein S18 acetylase RimI-like enzyme